MMKGLYCSAFTLLLWLDPCSAQGSGPGDGRRPPTNETLRAYPLGVVPTAPNASQPTEASSYSKGKCVPERDLQFGFGPNSDTNFTRLNGTGIEECCDVCSKDPNCFVAMKNRFGCLIADTIHQDAIVMPRPQFEQVAMLIPGGNFCDVCSCEAETRTIDCKGKNLAQAPGSFEEDWSPLLLDLEDNPKLTIFPSYAVEDIPQLKELRLPSNVAFVSTSLPQKLPFLTKVRMERNSGRGPMTRNVISDRKEGAFQHVCCSVGDRYPTNAEPGDGISFCDIQYSVPGSDAHFEPSVTYEGIELRVTTPQSSFLFEAAESEVKCAEYCSIQPDCNYFLFKHGSPAARVCTHFRRISPRRIKRDVPGYTAGSVFRTRAERENATVVVSSYATIVLDEETNYEAEYNIQLGSTPMRGAVWVTPTVVSATSQPSNLTISPSRVVLYNNETVATVRISIVDSTQLTKGGTVIIENVVESCDRAFSGETTSCGSDDGLTTYVDVVLPVPPTNSSVLVVSIVSTAVALVFVAMAVLYVGHKKRHADEIWKVKASELTFDDPPRIIGRGTFGMVLLAEYRGTQVAVKRVIPPKESQKTHFDKSDEEMGSLHGSTVGDVMASSAGKGKASSAGKGKASSVGKGIVSSAGLSSSSNSRSTASKTFSKQRSFVASALGYRDEYSSMKRNFVIEMRQLSKLRHPCITTVMGAVINKIEEPMLIMEYMDLGSLYDLLHNETMLLGGEHIRPVLRDIGKGIRFLHSAEPQVIHGDLKAQNILVDEKFRAKVADFGLSQKKTLGGTGTPYWMAPELLRGESANTSETDIYSFGILLYEVYARKEPYQGEKFEDVLALVADPMVNKRPPVPASCPKEIQQLMIDCVDRIPYRRPNSEVLDAQLTALEVASVEPGETTFSMQAKKRHQTESLLHDVFPAHIAQALREGRKVEPESHDSVTIFFSDLVGFTDISSKLTPIKISDMLDRLYRKFDKLSAIHDVFKVETIGDSWMGVTNLTKDQSDDHVKRIARFSVDAVKVARGTWVDPEDKSLGRLSIRVGFHTGPVVSNVVGSRNPRYCLFGDAVNTASRMESNSLAGQVQCSETSAEILRIQDPKLEIISRGEIEVKGKGGMTTYWVSSTKTERFAV